MCVCVCVCVCGVIVYYISTVEKSSVSIRYDTTLSVPELWGMWSAFH